MENKEPKKQYLKKRVLIVDDEYVMRHAIQDMLEVNNKNLKFYFAGNGMAAIQLLRKEKIMPDIIIMDINMPGMDGVEAINFIRIYTQTKNIPILVCTVRSARTDIIRMSKLRINGYLVKPFTAQSLQQKFYEILQIESPKPEKGFGKKSFLGK